MTGDVRKMDCFPRVNALRLFRSYGRKDTAVWQIGCEFTLAHAAMKLSTILERPGQDVNGQNRSQMGSAARKS